VAVELPDLYKSDFVKTKSKNSLNSSGFGPAGSVKRLRSILPQRGEAIEDIDPGYLPKGYG
jgi:hypothetical protein